jgi:hypothetical protein
MARKKVTRTAVLHPVASEKEQRDSDLISRVRPPLLTLDDIVITSQVGQAQLFTITWVELAALLSLRRAHRSIHGLTESGDTNLLLRGLGRLVGALGDSETDFDENVAYFVEDVLIDIASRLESGGAVSEFRVGLLTKDKKAVAS